MVPVGAKISNEEREQLVQIGVEFREVPWIIPPRLSKGVPIDSGGCCGAKEFIKLNAMSLTEYDAVLFYDTDVEMRSSVEGPLFPLFDCAASGYFLTTPAS